LAIAQNLDMLVWAAGTTVYDVTRWRLTAWQQVAAASHVSSLALVHAGQSQFRAQPTLNRAASAVDCERRFSSRACVRGYLGNGWLTRLK